MSNFKKAVSMLLAVAMILSMVSMVAFADETDPSAAPAEEAVSASSEPAASDAEVQTSTTDQEAADAVVGSAAGTTIANLPNDDVAYSQDYNFDYGLGLFELLPDGYWQTQQVKRADFAAVVAKMLKANTAGYPRYGQKPYNDVDETSSTYPAICYLTEIGILQGDGNTMFRPNDPILVEEASKMIMCALGYKDACEATAGGYPNGYTAFALREGIYNGLSLSYTSSMSAMQMSKMVRNAMQAYIMETLTYDSSGGQIKVIQSTKTLLSETYKMISARGIIEGTYFSYFGNAQVQLENEVVISDVIADVDGVKNVNLGTVTYQFADNMDLESYVGYAVNFYYMEDVSGYRRNYIAYFEPRETYNLVNDIDAKNISSLTSDHITYDDGNGRTRTIDLSKAAVSYNGVATSTKLTADENLRIEQGHVKVISHNLTNVADAVLIEEQHDGLFERYNASTKQVIFQNNMTSKMPQVFFDDSYHTRMTLNGQNIEPEDLQKNDVLTFTVSEDGMYITAHVSRDVIEDAIVESKYNDDYANGMQYETLVINGQYYYKSKDLEKTINPGFVSDFQLTYDGRIAGTNAAGSGKGNYGYLIDFGASEASFDSRFFVKILDMNGTLKEYRSATRVLTNIKNTGSAERVSANDPMFEQVFANPQLITFELNGNDEVKTMYYAPDYTAAVPSEDLFGKYFSGTSPYANHLMQTCAITNDTVIFNVPYEDRDRDEDYSLLTLDDLTESPYTVDIYDNYNGIANAIVIKDVNPSSLSNTAGVMLIDQVVKSWDADNQNEITEIMGWSKGEQATIKIDDTVVPRTSISDIGVSIPSDEIASVNDLKRGDVIQYNTTANGYLNSFRLLFNYTNRIKNGEPYGEWNEDGAATSYRITSGEDIRAIYGEVTSAYDYFMIATSNFEDMKWYRAYPTADTEIYIYDQVKDEIRKGEPFDIQIGDKVFVKVNNGDENYEIVVYQ